MRTLKLISCFLFTFLSINIYAAKIDGAIAFGGGSVNPAVNSVGFRHAIRLDRLDGEKAHFKLLSGGSWEGVGLYSNMSGLHETETYKMKNVSTSWGTFKGSWSNKGGDDYVLEGKIDLELLGLFNPVFGGNIDAYLTMIDVVNEDALVHAEVFAVPAPAPVWLMAPGLFGIIGLGRKRIDI